jgi:hypothetical protein
MDRNGQIELERAFSGAANIAKEGPLRVEYLDLPLLSYPIPPRAVANDVHRFSNELACTLLVAEHCDALESDAVDTLLAVVADVAEARAVKACVPIA